MYSNKIEAQLTRDNVQVKIPVYEENKGNEQSEKIKSTELQLKNMLEECQGSLLWELSSGISEFKDPVEFLELKSEHVQTGLNDLLLAEISQLGHRDKFPRPHDWENLLPTLKEEEELLWIAQKTGKSYKLYLGLKFNQEEVESIGTINQRKERFKILCSNFTRRAFPESLLYKKDANSSAEKLDKIITNKKVFCITGIPSYKTPKDDEIITARDEDARPFASINDVLESHHDIDDNFSIVFTISKAPHEDIKKNFENKFTIRNKIKPLITQTFSDTLGQAQGSNHGETKTKSEVSIQHTVATPKKDSIFKAVGRGVRNFFCGGDGQTTITESSTTPGDSTAVQSGSHSDTNLSVTMQYTVSNSQLEFLDARLEDSIKHLQQTPGTGGYYATSIVYSSNDEIGMSISRSLKAAMSGSHSCLRPMQIFKINGNTDFQIRNVPLYTVLIEHRFYPEILNCEKACLSLLLPDTELPGLKLKKNVFYARPENNDSTNERNIDLGKISYFSNPVKEKFNKNNSLHIGNESKLMMTSEDLCSHIFIVGTTGSGKTIKAASMLNNMPQDVRIIVLETAKKTYRNKLNRRNQPPLVYTLGNSQMRPFRFNPFFFEQETSLKQHISVLADAIGDLFPMESLIGPKLREAIENCYSNCGWDIETNEFIYKDHKIIYPDMIMFNSEVHKICETLIDYGNEVRSNYRGALLNRSKIFLGDIYQDIFAYDGNKTIDEIFQYTKDTIIEMEEMPPSEINMPAFIISILLHRIRAKQTLDILKKERNSNNKTSKFLIVIEEAHNVIDRKYEEVSDEKQSGKGGHLVNQIVRLLAEGRGLGLGLMVIDQSANKIAPSVIANTNTKLIFRQEDGEEIKTIGTAIGLKEEDWNDLQKLETGECIAKSKNSPKPVKLDKVSINSIGQKTNYSSNILFDKENVCAPYSRGIKMISNLFNRNFYTYDELDNLTNKIFDLCKNNVELVRYIMGKYLLSIKQYGLLELLPDVDSKINFKNILVHTILPDNTQIAVLTLLRAVCTGTTPTGHIDDNLNLDDIFKGIKKFSDCFKSFCFYKVGNDINYRNKCIKLCFKFNKFAEHYLRSNMADFDFSRNNKIHVYLKKYPPLMNAYNIILSPLDQENFIQQFKIRRENI